MSRGNHQSTMLEDISTKSLIAAFVAIFTLIKITQRVQKELKIRSLGGHTRRVKTWIPFGTYAIPFCYRGEVLLMALSDIDFIARSVKYSMNDK